MSLAPRKNDSSALALLGAGLVTAALASTLGEGGAEPTAMLAWHGLVGVILLTVLLGGRPAGAARPSPRPMTAFAAFALWAGVGAAMAPYAFAAFLVAVELALFLVVLVLASWCGPRLLDRAAPWLLAGAALHGLAAVAQRLFAGEPRPASTFLNSNHLAAWIVAVLLLNLPSLSRAEHTSRFVALATIPSLAGVVVSGSRGALLGLGAGATCWIAWTWPALSARSRRSVAVVAASVLVVVCAGIAWRFRQPDPFPYERVRIWRASLRAAAESPWLGTGPGQFGAAALNLNFPVESGPLRYSRYFSTPHSDLLRAPCEFGWPAAAALAIAALLAARAVRRGARAGLLPPVWRGAAAALAALGVQGAVDDLTSRPAVYVLAALLLGALLATPRVEGALRPSPPAWRALLAALLVLGFAVGEVAPYRAWRAARDLPRGRLDSGQRVLLAVALRSNAYHPDLWLRRAEDLSGNGSDWDRATYARAREAAERACRLQPADAVYLRGLARVEGFGVRTLFRDEAGRERTRALYSAAAERARTDPFYPLEEGEFLLSTGDAAGAAAAADRALAIEPQAVPPRLLRAEAILTAGGPDAAERAGRDIEEAERLAARWKGWPRLAAYDTRLLALDTKRAADLRARMAAAESGTGSDPPTPRGSR